MKKQTFKKMNKYMIVPFVVCVVLLVLLAVMIVRSLFTDMEWVAEQYTVGMLQNNPDAIYSMYVPEAITYVMRETELTEKDMKYNLRHKMSLWVQRTLTNEIGALVSADAELIDKQDVSSETVKELEQNFGVNAQSTKCLTVAYHAEGEKGCKDGELTVYVVKVGGKWYLYDLQMLLE